jgi:hypothetical protein
LLTGPECSNGLVTPPAMRAQVVESWYRSAAAGVRAETVDAPITLPEAELRDYREAHPLASVFPLLDDVLGQAARDCDTVMAVSDAEGQLLWVCGRPSVLRAAESIGFVEGSNWDERLAGTNAPGMALTLDQPVSVIGGEHFRHSVQRWNCAAAPIHDPGSGSLLGVLDITGGQQILVPQTMAMVRAAARMAEAELGRQQLTLQRSPASGSQAATGSARAVRLAALGRSAALLTIGHESRPMRLSPRHSELLVLLASTPNGLSGDELAVLLYEEDSSSSTLRAELNRLRSLLGEDLLASRPYRLTAEVSADWLGVEAVLASGDVAGALAGYRGPILSRSEAPGVVRLREGLESSLREAVLRSAHLDLMSRWTRSGWGSEDYAMWQAQAQLVQATSPLAPLIAGQLARMDRELT